MTLPDASTLSTIQKVRVNKKITSEVTFLLPDTSNGLGFSSISGIVDVNSE
jgi:hypothetical protein